MIDRVKALLAKLGRFVDRHVWARVARRAISRFLAHDDLQFAGSMAYFALLSLFQLLVLGVIAISFFVETGRARTFVVSLVIQATPLDAEAVSAIIESVDEARTGIGVLSVAFLLWAALGLFSAINKGINMAWSGPGGPPPSFLCDKFVGFILILLIAVLAIAAVGVGVASSVIGQATGGLVERVPGADLVQIALGLIIPLAFSFVALVLLYRIVPTPKVGFAQVWPGALVAAVMWEALRHGFTFYVTRVARYESAFGPISTGVTLLVFLYFASVILLLGAQIAEAHSVESGKTAAPAPAPVEVGPSVPLDPTRAPAARGEPPPR